jgi:hypothetical protein
MSELDWEDEMRTGDLTWGGSPYWSRAESRHSQGKILKAPRERAMTIYTETCVAISGQAAVIYMVRSLPVARVLRMRSDM